LIHFYKRIDIAFSPYFLLLKLKKLSK